MFLPVLGRLKLECVSWERAIDALPDSARAAEIRRFYDEFKKWNLPRRGGKASASAVTWCQGAGAST